MQLITTALCAIAAFPFAAADALSDFGDLQSAIQNVSLQILASIVVVNTTSNGTGLPNGTFLSLNIGNPFVCLGAAASSQARTDR